MKLTRVIAVGIILSTLGLSALNAQSLRNATPPAEFPPASYKGKQYVDSRGCIYIKAGIDGNITWVPRVSRGRKQVCGFKPTGVAGATSAPAHKAVGNPVIITANPPPKAVPKTASKTVPKAVPKTAPKVSAKPAAPAKPRRKVTTARPAPVKARPVPAVVAARPKVTNKTRQRARAPAPVVTTTRRKPSVPAAVQAPARVPAKVPASTPTVSCPNASAFSQRFINKPGGRNKIRCGPQSEVPITYGRGEKHSAVSVTPATRVVARHVFDNRQNTTDVTVPSGYRTVWRDDRLNPHRAERTLRADRVASAVTVPSGYRRVGRKDNRLNALRGIRTAEGNAQTNRIWSNTVPRVLRRVPTQGQVVTARTQATVTRATRLSTRSAVAATPPATGQGGKRFYVRVVSYAADSEARATAISLTRLGLPMNLGTVRSSGNKVVLAGPFASVGKARAALKKVRRAGYRKARLNK